MKTKPNELEFGLRNEIPEGSPAGWGARAIQQNDQLDFLFDRQDLFAVNEKVGQAFLDMFNRSGYYAQLQAEYTKAFRAGKLQCDLAEVVTLIDTPVFAVKADTRGSFGYVYLCAYIKPSSDVSSVLTKENAKEYEQQYESGRPRWSASFPVPQIGDHAWPVTDQMGIKECVVFRLSVDCGFVHAWVWPLAPSAKYKRGQWKVGKKGWGFTNLAGIECSLSKPVTKRNRKEKQADSAA